MNEKDSKPYIANAVSAFEVIMQGFHPTAIDSINVLTRGEMFVLGYLNHNKGDVTPSELSASMNSSAARISAILNALEKKGQIERHIDGSNRRNILVTLTPLGVDRIVEKKKVMRASLSQVFNEMGEEDTIMFIELLMKFGTLSHEFLADK